MDSEIHVRGKGGWVIAGTTCDEIEGPTAIVILGGLISTTMLTLLSLPSLAGHFVKFDIDTRQ